MRILIGGSPSTGSSVFRQMLNRHPQVFCGPETNLFCYPELYRNWKSARRRLLLPGLFGLQKADVRLIRGVHLEDPEIGWTHDALHTLLRAHTTFTRFCDAFFEKPKSRYQKVHWAEKTPANVLQFRRFMQSFEDAFIVHVVRDPYDTVASLMARGISAYHAASIYLLYTSHGLALRGIPGYLEVQYESLVTDAAGTLNNVILQPLDLQFTAEILNEGNQEMTGVTQMQGWRSDELQKVSARSISRYADESEESRLLIATALASVRLKAGYVKQHQLQHDMTESICKDLDYVFQDDSAKQNQLLLSALNRQRQHVLRELFLPRMISASMYPVELIG